MKLDITISIDNKKIILNTSQTDDYNGIQKKLICQYQYIMIKSPAIYQRQTRIL